MSKISLKCNCQSSKSKLPARHRLPKSMVIDLSSENDEDGHSYRTTDGAFIRTRLGDQWTTITN